MLIEVRLKTKFGVLSIVARLVYHTASLDIKVLEPQGSRVAAGLTPGNTQYNIGAFNSRKLNVQVLDGSYSLKDSC